MAGQNWIHERVVAIDEIEYRPILIHHIEEKTNRLLKHCLAQFVVKRRKALAIHAVELLETAKIKPVAFKLRRQHATAGVLEHPAYLRRAYFRPLLVSRL